MRATTFCSIMSFAVIAPVILLTGEETATAAMACHQCHGTNSPVDNRPLDAGYRNITTGGFPGSHRTHMGKAATPASCARCHPGSHEYTAAHRDGLIKLAGNINGSPVAALYRNATSAFRQSATPAPGSCTSVNCHFESPTPLWGSDPGATTCATCHGAPPAGSAPANTGGAAGSHGRHNIYYPATAGCVRCHSDHTADPSPFAHATSSGMRGLSITLRDPLDNPAGSYTAPAPPDYLPSQAAGHSFGVCSNTYCHSTVQANGGTGEPSYGAPAWGTALASCNGTCHGVGDHGNDSIIGTGSHPRHLAYQFGQGNGYASRCTTCHLWRPPTATVGCAGCHNRGGSQGLYAPEIFTKHVNGRIDISFNQTIGGGAYGGSGSPLSKAPRTGYASCANTYCHSDGTAVATGSVPPNVTPTWGTGPLPCSSCHGTPPSYPSGSPKANSHAPHSGSGTMYGGVVFGCQYCHGATTADGVTVSGGGYVAHVDKAYTVAPAAGLVFMNITVAFSYTYSQTGGTCTNISCHLGNSAIWGQAPAAEGCLLCHPM